MRYYPVYLDLKDRAVLIVGGGKVAEGKIEQLVNAGARVRVVSPKLTPRLGQLVAGKVIEHRAGLFTEDDLDGVMLVISATDDRAVNEAVARAANARQIFCNVVDRRALCSFIAPALLTRGELQISISSAGLSPALVQRVKREIAELIGEEYGELLELAAQLRHAAKERVPDFERRRALFHAFIESEALEMLRAKRRDEAWQIARQLLNQTTQDGNIDLSTKSQEEREAMKD